MTQPKALIDDLDIREIPPDFKPDANGAAPRVQRPTGAARKTNPAPLYKEGMFVEPLSKLYGAIALGIMPFNPNMAETIAENAESCAQSWDQWAKTSPKIRKLLAPSLEAGGAITVAVAHAPIAVVAIGPKWGEQMQRIGAKVATLFQRPERSE